MWWWALGGLVVAIVAADSDAVTALLGDTSLLPDGTVTVDGETPADPAALAAGKGVSLDVYALARMIASEAGGQKQIAQQAVAAVAVSHAADEGKSISAVLLHATHAGNGFFGKQAQGRYAATSRDPSSAQLGLAAQVIAGELPDPTGGARQWDSPRAYDDPSDADATERKRLAAGNELVILPGVPASTFRFWRPA